MERQLFELFRLEFLKTNGNFYEITKIDNTEITLKHVMFPTTFNLFFTSVYNMIDYLLYIIYDTSIHKIQNLDIVALKKNDYYSENNIKYYIYNRVYDMFEDVNLADVEMLNMLDEVNIKEVNIELGEEFIELEKDTNIYINSIDYNYNKLKDNLIQHINIDYNLTKLEEHNIVIDDNINLRYENINFILKNVKTYTIKNKIIIDLDIIVILNNKMMFSTRIHGFEVIYLNDKNKLNNIIKLNSKEFKINVLNKLFNNDTLTVDTDFNTGITLYEMKNKFITDLQVVYDFYLDKDNIIIDYDMVLEILHNYIRYMDVLVLDLSIFREYLLLNLGLNILTYQSFLKLSEKVFNDFTQKYID